MTFFQAIVHTVPLTVNFVAFFATLVAIRESVIAYEDGSTEPVQEPQCGCWLQQIWPNKQCNAADVQVRDSVIPCAFSISIQGLFWIHHPSDLIIGVFITTTLFCAVRLYVTTHYAKLLRQVSEQ